MFHERVFRDLNDSEICKMYKPKACALLQSFSTFFYSNVFDVNILYASVVGGSMFLNVYSCQFPSNYLFSDSCNIETFKHQNCF